MFIGSLNEVVQSILTQMLRGGAPSNANEAALAKSRPPWDDRRQAWVLRPTRVILGVLWCILLGFGAAAGVMSYLHFSFVVACALGVIAISAGVGLLLWRKSVLLVDHLTIVNREMLGVHSITMYHDEVVDVRYSPFLRSFVIIDVTGQRVYLSTWIRGVRQVLQNMAVRPHHLRRAADSRC